MSKAEDNQKDKLFSFRWVNFRSLKNPGWVDIKPLTIFIGPNNSGKSSFIYPLLVLKQTLESRDITLPLKTKGKFVNVGDYQSLINNHRGKKVLKLEIKTFFGKPEDKEKREIGGNPPNVISLSFKSDTNGRIQLKSYQLKDTSNREMLKRVLLENGDYSLDFPVKKFKEKEKELEKIITEDKPRNFLFNAQGIFTDILKSLVPIEGESPVIELKIIPKKPLNAPVFYLVVVGYAEGLIKELFRRIDYIGPLRQHPQRYYERLGERPYSVGPVGQYAPELLFQMYKSDDQSSINAINEWLEKFGLGGDIRCSDYTSDLFSIVIKKSDERTVTNIADLGFGISQVLPLITQGIWMGEGRTLITEQPEIHLNPKLQTTLADFFVYLVNKRRSIIIETHSEHFLMRVRTLIADPANKLTNSDVALYFVEEIEGETSITQIPIGEDGYIADENWPRKFFADGLAESLELATMQSKRLKNDSKS